MTFCDSGAKGSARVPEYSIKEQLLEPPADYAAILADLKDQIKSARLKAGLAVNRELVLLYWRIGRQILTQQHEEGWGSKVIDRLSLDLMREFPEMKGLSSRNLKYMRAFYEAYSDETIVQQLAAQIPWFHNCVLLDKVKRPEERVWYIRQNISHGWSRSILIHQIESGLYERQGRALVNFDRTLSAPQSELARQILKDPYNFDFLTLGNALLPKLLSGEIRLKDSGILKEAKQWT